ncbi:MAG TPA: hypothetical protein PKI46_04935, partial [Bacteroidales bacterium]|nr:hypothetical protein [Bacteroidales bacterium]
EIKETYQRIEANAELSEGLKQEFEKYPSVIDIYELKDGYSQIKEDVKLGDKEIFNFRERVKGVNQRLHGIYNSEDAAILQRNALGRLGMQFRKWMRPMWNKRFGRRFGKTDYNERVRDYESGMYTDTFKFLFKPVSDNWKEYKNQQERSAVKAFGYILEGFKNSMINWKLRYHTLSEVEKANFKRTAAEMLFLASVIILGYMAKGMKDADDDERKDLVLALYFADRLYGELTTFTPMGIAREGNRLFNSPSPVFNTVEDVFKLLKNLFLYPIRDEEDRVFKTGIYHGHDKVEIYGKDLIPVYTQYQRLKFLNENMQRYNMFR